MLKNLKTFLYLIIKFPKIANKISANEVPAPKNTIPTPDIRGFFMEDTPIKAPYKRPQGKKPKSIPMINGDDILVLPILEDIFLVKELFSILDNILNPKKSEIP